VYARSPGNLERIVAVLEPLKPYLRGVPGGLPFRLDKDTLSRGLNFTLQTALGDLDLLGEVTGGGSYEDLLPLTMEIELFGSSARCVTLPALIALKRAAGRPKDIEVVAELEALLDEQGRSDA